MANKYRIVIEVEADESDRGLDLEALREGLARTLSENYSVYHDQCGWDEVSALVTDIRVDGSGWDEASETLVS